MRSNDDRLFWNKRFNVSSQPFFPIQNAGPQVSSKIFWHLSKCERVLIYAFLLSTAKDIMATCSPLSRTCGTCRTHTSNLPQIFTTRITDSPMVKSLGRSAGVSLARQASAVENVFRLRGRLKCSSTSVRMRFQCLSNPATKPMANPRRLSRPRVQTLTRTFSSFHCL